MKYLKVFNTHADYEAYMASNDKQLPNVSCCTSSETEVHYNPYVETAVVANYLVFPEIVLYIDDFPEGIADDEYGGDMNAFKKDFVDDKSTCNKYIYTGQTLYWEDDDETYYLWVQDDDYIGHSGNVYYLLTNRLDFSGESLEDDITNNVCPFVYILNEDMDEYDSEGHRDYILVSYENNNNNPTKITTDYSYFTEYEIDEKEEIQAVDEYLFDSEGEHLVKLYLDDPTQMGDGIFQECNNLLKIRIPDSVTSIGDYAFRDCIRLTSVRMPDSVTTIGPSAFSGCSGLTGTLTIPNSVTSIGDYAFHYCQGLTSITIPTNVTSIGDSTFSGCSGLTSVTIPTNVTSIGDSTFSGCSGLTSITIPSGVTSIGSYAFYYCTSLTSVTIPSGVTTIGSGAFLSCSGLTTVTLNSNSIVSKTYTVSANFKNIFGNQVTQYIIGDGVTSIGTYAFYNCSGLTGTLTIPNSVTSIGDNAFKNCSGITSLTIQSGVTGYNAFYGCSGLTSLTIGSGVTSIGSGAFGQCSGLTSITIPDNVTTIDSNAFNYCTGLTSLTIGSGVTSIGSGAFIGCLNLTSVTIPDSVTSMGTAVFQNCSGLTSVTIGSGITSIADHAFYYCTGLTSITIQATTPPTLGIPNAFESTNNCPIYVPSASVSAYRAATNWSTYTSRIQAMP